MSENTSHASEPNKTPESGPPKIIKPKRRTVIIMLLVALAGVCAIMWAWRLGPFDNGVMKTENSYVRGQVTVLAPQVSGYVSEVLVNDFDQVSAGQPLVRIDDRIYRARVSEAEGKVANARAQLANAEQSLAQNAATLAARQADLSAAEAENQRAGLDVARVQRLAKNGSVSGRENEQAQAQTRLAQANVLKAKADIRIAQETQKATAVSRQGLQAQLAIAEAQRDLANIDLANTLVRAPRAGQINEASVRQGQYVTAGSQLMFLVPEKLWVIANFKETQVNGMTEGMPASFRVDALDGLVLHGHIEKFAPGMGSEFSVLRADNASGNFTKVVQRLPVRIAIDPDQQGVARLRPGMSVESSVNTRQRNDRSQP